MADAIRRVARAAVAAALAILLLAIGDSHALGDRITPAAASTCEAVCASGFEMVNERLESFTFFTEALNVTRLAVLLRDPAQDVTIFAANDATYTRVGVEFDLTWEAMLGHIALPISTLNHLVNETLTTADLKNGTILHTLLGEDVVVLREEGHPGKQPLPIMLQATESVARIISSDHCNCRACNVVVHTLDNVLATAHPKSRNETVIKQIMENIVQPLIQKAEGKLHKEGDQKLLPPAPSSPPTPLPKGAGFPCGFRSTKVSAPLQGTHFTTTPTRVLG